MIVKGNFGLRAAENKYFEYIITKMLEIEKRNLPEAKREKQVAEMMKHVPRGKMISVGKDARKHFMKAYNMGKIHDEELDDIMDNLDELDKNLKKEVKLQTKKGTTDKKYEQKQEQQKQTNTGKKRTIKKVGLAIGMAFLVGSISIGAINANHRKEEAKKQQKILEHEQELEQARRILEDREKSVYSISAGAKDNEDGEYLIEEVKKVFIDQYNKDAEMPIQQVSLIKENITIGRNSTTGEVVHAERDMIGYINKGFDINAEPRYLIFDGDAYGEDGKYIAENFLGECTEQGEIFTDSNALSDKASEILAEMAGTSGIEYTKYNGNVSLSESMLKGAFDFYSSYNYGDNYVDLGNIAISYYTSANQYYINNDIDLNREYANNYITDVNGKRITHKYNSRNEYSKEEEQAIKLLKIENAIKLENSPIKEENDGWELV